MMTLLMNLHQERLERTDFSLVCVFCSCCSNVIILLLLSNFIHCFVLLLFSIFHMFDKCMLPSHFYVYSVSTDTTLCIIASLSFGSVGGNLLQSDCELYICHFYGCNEYFQICVILFNILYYCSLLFLHFHFRW